MEQRDVPPYSYLRLRTESGDVWVAVPTARIDTNNAVTVVNPVPLKDFETGLAGQRLELVYLGSLKQVN